MLPRLVPVRRQKLISLALVGSSTETVREEKRRLLLRTESPGLLSKAQEEAPLKNLQRSKWPT